MFMTGIYGDKQFAAWTDWLKEVIASKALTLFEPETNLIPNVRPGQARFISGRLAKALDDSFIEVAQSYGRHTTLAGIHMFLAKDHKREYLVTAFGKRRGSGFARPAQFQVLHISHGATDNVRFSHACIDRLQKHVRDVNNAEVLVFHNHPRNLVTDLLSQIIGWSPLPSNMDRETMYEFKYRTIVQWLASGNLSNLRFFLVENGGLREILIPSVNTLTKLLGSLASGQRV